MGPTQTSRKSEETPRRISRSGIGLCRSTRAHLSRRRSFRRRGSRDSHWTLQRESTTVPQLRGNRSNDTIESSARDAQRNESKTNMKVTTRVRPKRKNDDDLRPEYRIDYGKTKPNRFARYMQRDSIAVVLDPDVAEVFDSQESVNAVLRALLKTMPTRKTRKAS